MRGRSVQYQISDDGELVRLRLRNVNGAPRMLELDYDTVVELGLVLQEVDAEMTEFTMTGEEGS
jgi:hypothetical protein